MFKKHIPNLLTLANLLCGLLAVLMAISDRLIWSVSFILLGIFFDFFDGYFARLLKVGGNLGKELDSLADVVTSGVAPGFIMFQLLTHATKGVWFSRLNCEQGNWQSFEDTNYYILPFLGLLIPLASAMRLAKFNIDERQTTSFIGMPTPGFSLFVASLPLIYFYADLPFFVALTQNVLFLVLSTVAGSILLNAELPMFSLKFDDYSWKGNEVKYTFLILSVFLLFLLKIVAVPVIIICYIFFSVIDNLTKKTPAK
jgi:CDP-diacylglycerol---serine O-phosphatidyltransferase